MRTNQIVKCDSCPKEESYTKFKRMNGSWRCIPCYRKKIKDNREHLKRDVLGIRKKEDLVKEWEARRKLREALSKEKPSIMNILGNKNPIRLRFYITKDERTFLFRKYKLQGLDYESSQLKIDRDTKYLTELVNQLRRKNHSEKNINSEFKEHFAKLLMENGN